MASRIYLVVQKSGDTTTEHLVRAANSAQAVNAVSKPQFSADVASQDDVFRLAKTHAIIEAGE